MAKQKGPVSLVGKMGGVTFTKGKTGRRARPSAEFTQKQKADARQRPQVTRTGPLNKLASPLRHAIRHYNYGDVDPDFWGDLLKAFRKEKTDHRVLLLKQIVGLEADKTRTFEASCPVPLIFFKTTARQYLVDTDFSKPATVRKDNNCYYLQFIMIVWNKDNDSVRHMDEQTGWLNPGDKGPKFATLKFTKTAADTEWVLVCRLVEGQHEKEFGYTSDCRVRIIDSGTVSAESQKILEQRAKELAAEKKKVAVTPVVKEKKKLVIRDKL